MALSDLTSITVDIDVIRSQFRSFTPKDSKESVSYYEVIGLVGDELIAINTLSAAAETLKAGDTATVKIAHNGFSNVRAPKFKLLDVLETVEVPDGTGL